MKFSFRYIVVALTCSMVLQLNAQAPVNWGVGNDAPELTVLKWLKGTEPVLFQKGKVYVIDLWATWCIPCIASMPHLSKLQELYKDQGLEVVGITSADKYGNSEEKIEGFVAKKDSILAYKVAIVPPSWNKDSTLLGIFVHPWMQKIGSMNLPTAFIVDRNGKIAYIGDPHTIDEPLKKIIDGTYNLPEARKEYTERLTADKEADKIVQLLKAGKTNMAIVKSDQFLHKFKHVKPNTYLILASEIVNMKSEINNKLIAIATICAQKGIELTRFESPGFYDLLAAVYAKKGDYFDAIIAERCAIALAEGEMKANQEKNLSRYMSLIKK